MPTAAPPQPRPTAPALPLWAASPPARSASLFSTSSWPEPEPSLVRPLRQDLQDALPTLSPKLRRVARYCLQHAATLHLRRIQDVASGSDTVPATVVRLAQRLGLRGFQELKLAFLDPAPAAVEHEPSPAAPPARPGLGSSAAPAGQWAGQRALLDIDASLQAVAALKALVQDASFAPLVQALRVARAFRFDWAGEADRAVALHLQSRLRALGCHQVGASKATPGKRGEWLLQVAVCDDKAWGARAPDSAAPGARVLRLVRGRISPALMAPPSASAPATRAPGRRASRPPTETTLIRCGADPRRILTALAFCELLATALAPEPEPALPGAHAD